MSKKSTFKPGVRTREDIPLYKRDKDGVVLLCPFCTPSHPIVPGTPSPCGTSLRVTAVQNIISSRMARQQGLVCVKCRKEGHGEMVQYMNGFVHVEDCAPDVQLLTEVPTYSRLAKMVFQLPEKIRNLVEKRTGVVQVVRGLTPDGQETGKVEGYFFGRKAAQNG